MGDTDFLAAIAGNAESCVRYFDEVLGAPPLDYSRSSLSTVDDFLDALHLGVEPPGQTLENVVQLVS